MSAHELPIDVWFGVVKSAPLVSIDLIVQNSSGEVLLGWRTNRPAQNSWFVPGGVVRKGETLDDAFQRVMFDELGVLPAASEPAGSKISMVRSRCFSGVYEHHYEDNFIGEPGVPTHYVVLAHRLSQGEQCPVPSDLNALPKAQHKDYKWMAVTELLNSPQVHANVKAYFNPSSTDQE